MLVLYLSDINGSDKNGDGEEWINAINHGCLWQVNKAGISNIFNNRRAHLGRIVP